MRNLILSITIFFYKFIHFISADPDTSLKLAYSSNSIITQQETSDVFIECLAFSSGTIENLKYEWKKQGNPINIDFSILFCIAS